jgi:hypothetical protein
MHTSPQIHQELARQRQADMLREAQRERLAAVAAGRDSGPRLAWAWTLMASVSKHVRRRPVTAKPAASTAV